MAYIFYLIPGLWDKGNIKDHVFDLLTSRVHDPVDEGEEISSKINHQIDYYACSI